MNAQEKCGRNCGNCCSEAIWLDNNNVMPPLPVVRREAAAAVSSGTCCRNQDSVREVICRVLDTPGEVIFTSGGTENAFLISAGTRYAGRTRIVGSVVDPLCMLLQPDIEILPLDTRGYVCAEDLRQLLQENSDIAAVSLTLVNGEYGIVSPVEALAQLVKMVDPEIFVYVDAAQACTRLRLNSIPEEVDAVGISAAKIGGLPGAGALWLRDPDRLDSLLPGGSRQHGIRGGSLNEIGIMAMGVALRRSLRRIDQDFEQLSVLRSRLDEMLLNIDGVHLNFGDKALVCNTSNYYVEGVDSRRLSMVLQRQGLKVSDSCEGVALTTLRTPLTEAAGFRPFRNIRLSLSIHNTTKDLEQAYLKVSAAVREFRSQNLGN